MATLLIPTQDFAAELETDLEGRLEVMADDGLSGKPDYEDAESVAQMLREAKSFPATIELSDAEAQQAAISVENVVDLLDAHAEAGYAEAFRAVQQHMKAQGYPR